MRHLLVYLLLIFVLPPALAIAVYAGLSFWVTYSKIEDFEPWHIFILPLFTALFVYLQIRDFWKSITQEPNRIKPEDEPEYLAVFRYSKIRGLFFLLFGLGIAALFLYLFKHVEFVFFALMVGACAYPCLAKGLRLLVVNTPQLKIAAEGTWTPRFGFRHWQTSTLRTEILGEVPLAIRWLVIGIHSEAKGPLEVRLLTKDLKKGREIKPLIALYWPRADL